jgi:hypothetical protein
VVARLLQVILYFQQVESLHLHVVIYHCCRFVVCSVASS